MSSEQIVLAFAFWCATCLVLYTYVGYPLWIYLMSRMYSRPQHQDAILPNISIILAVHNGAALLRQKVDHLLSLDYPRSRMEIVIVSDGSTDGTDEILQEFPYPLVRSIRCSEHCGKATAVNKGMQSATGDILLFFDIRPWIEIDGLKMLLSNFSDPQVGCASGELVLREKGHDPGAKAVGGLYWRYEQWIRNCEARVDS